MQHDLNQPWSTAGAFDVVMANHVLYLVDDIDRSVGYLCSQLREGGRFVATMNADTLPVPVLELHKELATRMGADETGAGGSGSWVMGPGAGQPFNAENGAMVLARSFARVDVELYGQCLLPVPPERLVETYRSTGRFRDLCELIGESPAAEGAYQIAMEWEQMGDSRRSGVSVMALLTAQQPR